MTSQTRLVPTESYTSPAEADTREDVIDGLIAMLLTMHRWIWRRHETITLLDLTTFTRTTRFEVDLDYIPAVNIAGTGPPLGLVPLAICRRNVALRNATITDSDGDNLGWTTKDSNMKITCEILERIKEKSPDLRDAIQGMLGAEMDDTQRGFPGGYLLIAFVPPDGLPRRVITVTQEERVCEVDPEKIDEKALDGKKALDEFRSESERSSLKLTNLPIENTVREKDRKEGEPRGETGSSKGIRISHSLTEALAPTNPPSRRSWHRCHRWFKRWFKKLFSLRTEASLFFEFDCLADANSIHFEVVAPPETQVESLDLVWDTVGGPEPFQHEDKGVRAHIFPRPHKATRGSNRGRMAFLHVKIRANDEMFAGAAMLLAVFSALLLILGALAVGFAIGGAGDTESLAVFATILAVAPALVATFLVRPDLNQLTATLVTRLRLLTAVIGAVPLISVSIAAFFHAAGWAGGPPWILGIGAALEFVLFFPLPIRWLARKRNSGTKDEPFESCRALWDDRCARVYFAEVTDACREPLNPPQVVADEEKEIWTDATLNEYARTFAAGAGWLTPRGHPNTKAPAITARTSVADMASASRTDRTPDA